jgi:hypothetical protein
MNKTEEAEKMAKKEVVVFASFAAVGEHTEKEG